MRKKIKDHLDKSFQDGLAKKKPSTYLKNFNLTENYSKLANCTLVIECTIENLEIKKNVYRKIEEVIAAGSLLTSNTSSIPISILQQQTQHPERFFGLHWAEPSHTTRFLEIICGAQSDIKQGEYLYRLCHTWGKEPTLVRKDIRGFITNRVDVCFI